MLTLRETTALLFISLTAAACQGGGIGANIPSDSTEFYRAQAQSVTAISAEKDSILIELTETTKLITDISTELATIQTQPEPTAPVVGGEGVQQDERAEVLRKVRSLNRRLRQTESRLNATRNRVDSLTSVSDSLRSTLAVYVTTISELEGLVESQKETIRTLTDQISSLTAQNVALSEEKAELEDTVAVMDERENEVYYTVGTKKELMERGVITEEGGTRFLVFTRTGETLVPARVLDPAQFTRADRRTLTDIEMPKANKDYRIVSRHDLAYTEPTSQNKGKFRGTLRIVSPESFWASSKYLIIVEN